MLLQRHAMTPDLCRAFARYNRWMNVKAYAAAARLSDEERKRDRGAFFGSIHRLMNHLLVADRIWLGRLTGRVAPPGFMAEGISSLDQELSADFETLRAERGRTDDAIDSLAQAMSAETLAGQLSFMRRGTLTEVPTWWAVAQLFNHETHHRGQLSTLLFQAGQDPGVTDLFAMLVEEAAGAANKNASR